jgi:uncharacterized protein YvpB
MGVIKLPYIHLLNKFPVLSKAFNRSNGWISTVLCNIPSINQGFIALFQGCVYCSFDRKFQFGVA